MIPQGQIGLYAHWPFCLSKCPYCDFNTHVHDDIDHDRWQAAYLQSLEHYAALTDGRVLSSIFFGGGTPSLMRPETVGAIIDKARSLWPCVNDIEITLEANPTSVETQKFEAFREAGVNRVSIGVQALNDEDLSFLGRKHSVSEALEAIEIADKHFERFSFDLIYARPGQTLSSWEEELRRAAALAKGHLSLYQLTIERNTPFYYDYKQGLFCLPKEELAADFYSLTQDVLGQSGLPSYEVSNHAAEGHESRHNLIYWHYGDYIGIGPGAHGRLTMNDRKHATREHHAPSKWLKNVGNDGCGAHPFEALSPYDCFMEALMMGLRLREGVDLERLSAAGQRSWQDYLDMDRLAKAVDEGWCSLSDDKLTLSQDGVLRLNALIPYILLDDKPQAQVI